MPRQLRVFLCHASQDKPAVRELYKRLKAEDWIDPWLDEEKLSFGQHWTTTIEDALSDSDVVLIFLSKNSVQKEGFVQRELNYAWELSLEKPRNVIFLIPFRLDDCQIPRYLGSRQWGDYFGDKRESTYQILLRSLKQRHQQKLLLEIEDDVASESIAHKIFDEGEEREKIEKRIALKQPLNNENNQVVKRNKLKITSGVLIATILIVVLFVSDYFIKNPSNSKIPQEETATSTLAVYIGSPAYIRLPSSTPAPLFLTSAPEISPTPTLGIGSTIISGKDEMVLVYVPEGEFVMGEDGIYESSIHTVYLNAFWIDETEMTNKRYRSCVDAGVCEPPSSFGSPKSPSYFQNPEYDNYPVIYIDWYKANAYCQWAGRRLPTEAEWEKAARGTDERKYPWGDNPPNKDLLNYSGNIASTTMVKNYPNTDSFYGTYDMAGNVWEWVNDWYGYTDYQSETYFNNPLGPESGQYRVLKGGGWNHGSWRGYTDLVRSALRHTGGPTASDDTIGFRCVMDANP